MSFHRRRITLPLLWAILLVVAGCGKGGDDKKSNQLAAKVNGDEITVFQINTAMQRLGNVPEAQAKQAQKQVLDRLVDQQLQVQQAVDKKLDRDPRVMAAIEAARRQVLAQFYIEQVMGSAKKVNADQIKEFYAQHPELFLERRVYRFTQVAVAAQGDVQLKVLAKLEELDKKSNKSKVLLQLADWLKSQNIQFRAQLSTQAAEQLPLGELPKYHQMKVSDLMITPSAQGVMVSQLTAAQTQSLTEQQAQSFIEQYLQNRERMKLFEDEMKRLRAAAKIEYMGEFAKLDAQAPPSEAPAVSGTAATPLPPGDSQPARGPGEEPHSADQDAMTKGLKGSK